MHYNDHSKLREQLRLSRDFALLNQLGRKDARECLKIIKNIIGDITDCFETDEVNDFVSELLLYLRFYDLALEDVRIETGMSEIEVDSEKFEFAKSVYKIASAHLKPGTSVIEKLLGGIVAWWFKTTRLGEAEDVFNLLSDDAVRLGFDEVVSREFRSEKHEASFALSFEKLSSALSTLGEDKLWGKAPKLMRVIAARWCRVIDPNETIFLSEVLRSLGRGFSKAEGVAVIEMSAIVSELGGMASRALASLENDPVFGYLGWEIDSINLVGQYAVIKLTLEDDPEFDEKFYLNNAISLLRGEKDLNHRQLKVCVACGDKESTSSIL